MDRKQEILITRSLQLVVEAQDAQDAQDLTFGTRNLKLGTKFAHFGSFWHLGFKFCLQDFTSWLLDPDMPWLAGQYIQAVFVFSQTLLDVWVRTAVIARFLSHVFLWHILRGGTVHHQHLSTGLCGGFQNARSGSRRDWARSIGRAYNSTRRSFFISLCTFVHCLYCFERRSFLNMNDLICFQTFQPWNHLKPLGASFRLSFGAFAKPSIVSSSLWQIGCWACQQILEQSS